MDDTDVAEILEKSLCARCIYSVYREWTDLESDEELCDFTCIPTQADLLTHSVNYCTMFEELDSDQNLMLNNKFL